jgi:hypothetical protein
MEAYENLASDQIYCVTSKAKQTVNWKHNITAVILISHQSYNFTNLFWYYTPSFPTEDISVNGFIVAHLQAHMPLKIPL